MQSYTMGLHDLAGPKWTAITWSVSVEEQFYVVMPLLFLLLRARTVMWVSLVAVFVAPLVRMMLLDDVGFYAGYMFFPGRFDTIL